MANKFTETRNQKHTDIKTIPHFDHSLLHHLSVTTQLLSTSMKASFFLLTSLGVLFRTTAASWTNTNKSTTLPIIDLGYVRANKSTLSA